MAFAETADTVTACQLCGNAHPQSRLKAIRVSCKPAADYTRGHIFPILLRVLRSQFARPSDMLRLKNVVHRQACPICCRAEIAINKGALFLNIFKYLILGTVMVFALDHFSARLDTHYSPMRDTLILLAVYLLALLALYMAYQGGGRAWAIRHGIFRHYDKAEIESGFPPYGLISVLQRLATSSSFWEVTPDEQTQAETPKQKRRKRDWVFSKSLFDQRKRIDIIVHRRENALAHDHKAPHLWKTAVSGFWGEAIILTIAALAFIIVIWQCKLTSLFVFFQEYKVWTFCLNLFVVVVIIDYCIRQVYEARHMGRASAYCGDIANAYTAYAFYCWLLFAFGALMLGVLLSQFIAYDAIFTAARDNMIGSLSVAEQALRTSADSNAEHIWLSNLEMALGQLSGLNIILQKQMTPIFLVTSLFIIINIAITHTALKDLFLENAKILTAIFTFIPLVFILLICIYTYLHSYDVAYNQIETYIAAGAKNLDEHTDSEIIRRNAEILAEISRSNTIFGFISAVGGNASGASIFAGIAKLTLDWLDNNKKKIKGTDVALREHFQAFRPTSSR